MSRKKSHKSLILKEILNSTTSLEKKKVERKMMQAYRINQGMIKKGMNKSQFAKAIGRSKSLITKWLSGTQNFTTDTIIEIETVLDISLSEKIIQKLIVPRFSVGVSSTVKEKSRMSSISGTNQYNYSILGYPTKEERC